MLYQNLPSPEVLKSQAASLPFEVLEFNGHFHTPYSFSAFTGMDQVFDMARNENVKILGINDFYVTDGYAEFADYALRNQVFPLFNIEFIALSKTQQAQGIRVNDPNNPGRTYFSGKGLDFPFTLSGTLRDQLDSVKAESQRQVAEMIEKLNAWLAEIGSDMAFTYEGIRSAYARQLVRERHIAKALRIAVFEKYATDAERREFLQKLYGGKPSTADLSKAAALENELRNNLLKSGGKAFVAEDDKAFLSVEEVRRIILAAGGIPCYPVLLDDKNGHFTDFEADRQAMLESLESQQIYSIELIPGRNSLNVLEPFVQFFSDHGFVVTLGTEHNAPDMIPLTIDCRGHEALSETLRRINYEGACVVAAHQYLRTHGLPGYVDAEGRAALDRRQEFVVLGNAVIRNFVGKK